MIGKLLMFLGLRKASKHSFMRRNGAFMAPIGGVPGIAWLAYQNRAKLRAMYSRYLAPQISKLSTLPGKLPTLSRGTGARTSQPYHSAVI